MKTYIRKDSRKEFYYQDQYGQWPDRSPMTVEEHAKKNPSEWIEGYSEQNKSEVYDIAKSLVLAFAQGGVNAPVADCIEKAKELIKFKDGI